jgi:protein O-GlcNAc transferase
MTVDTIPGSGEQFAEQAIALMAEGCFEAALAPLRLALSCGDARPATMLNLAIAEDRTGDRAHARTLMRTVAVRQPDWDEPVLRLAESFRAAAEAEAAEEAYRQVLALNPVRLEALLALGGLLLQSQRAEEARDLLLRACGAAPGNAEAWNVLGLALQKLNEPKTALSAFVKAQSLQPTVPGYILNGVRIALEAGEADAELARLTVAGEQDPLNPMLQLGRGMLLERMGQRPEAIDALEAAAALSPDAIMPLSLLGTVLGRSARVRETEAVLRRVMALDPDCQWVRNDLASTLMRLYRHAEARALLLEAIDRFGPDAATLCNLANATVYVGLQDDAVAVARRAISLDPAATLPWGGPCAAPCRTRMAQLVQPCWRPRRSMLP